MLQWLSRLISGYLLIRMIARKPTASPERFFNLCMANRIVLWDISQIGEEYRFRVRLKDFRRIRPVVRKAKVHLNITGKCGLPFFVQRNRKRTGYLTGILLFFLILLLMSRFVWRISIDGNRQYSDDTLLHFLARADIRYGTRKASIDLERLEAAIRSDFDDIIWVSARISGTKLEIRVKENDGVDLPEENVRADKRLSIPGNLVASKPGIITRLIVRNGKAAVSVGDTVEAGQVLVSGELPIENDDGETDHIRYVSADADVYARTEETIRSEIPERTKKRIMTGKVRRGLRLTIGPISFLFFLCPQQNECWEIRTEPHQAVLLDDFYLPVQWDTISAKEYQIYEREWYADEREMLKKEKNQEKIDDFLEKGVQILKNDVTIWNIDAGWEIRSHFVLEESIGIFSAIPHP